MHDKFEITPDRIKLLAKDLHISEKKIKEYYDIFSKKILSEMKGQYLSHIIRTFENKLREVTGNPLFQIRCEPLRDKNLNVGCSQYFKGRYFTAFYHPGMDDKQLRVCLSHELGHLFLVELSNSSSSLPKIDYKDTHKTEPISTLFGFFTIIDKNQFYSCNTDKYIHTSFEAILADFLLLTERKNGN